MSESVKYDVVYLRNGISFIHRPLSAITAYVIPRSQLAEINKQIPTLPGIFFLTGENIPDAPTPMYIGYTGSLGARLSDCDKKKGFWNKAIVFLSDRNTFSLDILLGLKSYAIKEAHKTNKYNIKNCSKPKYSIKEYDLPLIKEAYKEINFIMNEYCLE